MAIAYSIYIINSNGEILEFTSGEKTTFEITEYPYDSLNIQNIDADFDFENFYVSDAQKRNVVILDDEGKYVKQYQTSSLDTWGDMKDFSVCPAEDEMFILNGTKIYSFSLQ